MMFRELFFLIASRLFIIVFLKTFNVTEGKVKMILKTFNATEGKVKQG